MEDIVLINITGPDRPGLNACFAGILARYNVRVLDIGQSVIHEHISLGILAAIPCKKDFSAVFKDMLFEGYQLGLKVDIRPVVPDSYENGSMPRARSAGSSLYWGRPSVPVRSRPYHRSALNRD